MSRTFPSVLVMRSFALAAALFSIIPLRVAADPCLAVDNGSGTVNLPADGCGYVSPTDLHQIINGLPPGTTINIGAEHNRFFNKTSTPGGTLGGDVEKYGSTLTLTLTGTGTLSGYHRTVSMQAQCETHTGPRTPGAPVQSFDTQMFGIQGQLPAGDPDFDLLRITAGSGFGMPSPGHTTLTRQPGGNWAVDSFFDITYRIDFVGHSPGPMAGMSGSTTATIRMRSGVPAPGPCSVPDNGSGTVNLPPAGCPYLSPADVHQIINGLPAGTKINVGAQHQEFFNVQHSPDGTGGETEQFGSFLQLSLTGTGSLSSFHRTINLQTQCQAHTGPRGPSPTSQSFDTEMMGIQGQITGDPDFDLLRITAGSAFGMPSPGHTTLTRSPGSPNWNVDSFFDITYRIDFVGHSPGPLSGHSGSTTGTIRMQAGQPATTAVGFPVDVANITLSNRPNPFGRGTTIEYRLPQTAKVKLAVYDVSGKLVRTFINGTEPAGPHAMFWDGYNESGRKAATGTYFIKLAVNGKAAATRRAVLVK